MANPNRNGKGMKRSMRGRTPSQISYQINQTDLLASTVQRQVALRNGFIAKFSVIVQVVITTGGTIKVQKNGVDVPGATVTVANAAAVGTVVSATFNKVAVAAGDQISLVPASFATAGAVNAGVGIDG